MNKISNENNIFDQPTMIPSSQNFDEGQQSFVLPEIAGYDDLKEIGHGGMGTVYEAVQCSLSRKVAVKILNPGLSNDQTIVKRFQNEIRILARLDRHPSIVQVLDCGTSEQGQLYYVMELVTGKNGDTQTLRELISPQKKVASFINEKQTADLVLQVAEALQYAHENHIVHRDLKPENILIDDRFQLQAKVTDFGIAAWRATPEATELTSATSSFGTWAYMSPEQHRSASKIDHRADIYSLGVMIYEMLTGRLPMGAFVLPSKSNSSLNPNWDKLITAMLQQDPRDRPQNMQEVIDRVKTTIQHRKENTEISLERVVEIAISCVVSPLVFAYKNIAGASIFEGISQRKSSLPVQIFNIKSGGDAGERMTLTINNVEYAFRWCPVGTFRMGSPESELDRGNDEKQHRVTLSQGFWMQETEVTQEQWKSVMGSNPSHFKGSHLPVENVSWNDCQNYMRKLNALISSGYKFSLPTEAQWEYACRAGSTTVFSFGDTLNGYKANCNGNYPYGMSTKGTYLEKTVSVGSYYANDWGLYDMHGNIWEWCNDWYGDYLAGSVTDPTGANNGSFRVVRGGCWFISAKSCRSAFRGFGGPSGRLIGLGLRCSLVDKSK
ncbi:MAG: SUMF1/EgtB/PvdO family nonheme iron enzyme [Planctomycetaceae bacterium]|jgi:formylglycine-generating enzyme required for sulfatase activity|nr:SUMF1/EgtB/PvdO family nonheme iron enzyme [Planctomycetaceae bacterium]